MYGCVCVCLCVLIACLVGSWCVRQKLRLWLGLTDLCAFLRVFAQGQRTNPGGLLPAAAERDNTACRSVVCVCVTFLLITRHRCDRHGVYWAHMSNWRQLKWFFMKLVCAALRKQTEELGLALKFKYVVKIKEIAMNHNKSYYV